MKNLLAIMMLMLTACASVRVPNPQNWNSDILLQRLQAEEEQKAAQQVAHRVFIFRPDTITISDPF